MNTKWYWAYSYNDFTYLFNSLEEARDHAVEQGLFDEICGKDAMMAFDEELFFETQEEDLKDEKYLIMNEVTNGITS